MKIHLMIALLLGASISAAALVPEAAEAQNRMKRPVASAKPNIARTPRARPAASPAKAKQPATTSRRKRKGSGGNLDNRPNRPNRPNGGNGPDGNVVIVNGRPGSGYYDNGRYYSHDRYYDDDDDDFLEFVGKTAAVTAGVSVVSAVIGSIVKDKPSDDCQQQIQNGQVYLLCDGVWYTPAQTGGQTGYEVVAPPAGSGQ